MIKMPCPECIGVLESAMATLPDDDERRPCVVFCEHAGAAVGAMVTNRKPTMWHAFPAASKDEAAVRVGVSFANAELILAQAAADLAIQKSKAGSLN